MKLSTRLVIAALAGALTATAFHSNAAEQKEKWYLSKLDGTYTCTGYIYNQEGKLVRTITNGFKVKVDAAYLKIGPVGERSTINLLIKDFMTNGVYGTDAESGEVLLSKPSNWVNFRYIDRTSERQAVFGDCVAQSKLGF